MGFIHEYTSQDDIDKFKLDDLLNRYQNTTFFYKHHWAVDKVTNNWLIIVKHLNNFESIWIFHYKNTNIEIKLYKTEEGWDLTSIASNQFSNQEVISSLRDALQVLDNVNLAKIIKKEISSQEKKETVVSIRNVPKRKINYLDVLMAVVVIVIMFYIANDKNIVSIVKDEHNKTSKKIQSVKSKYNICSAEADGVYLSNSQDLKNQTKVVDIFKQLVACGVDKYGELYWTNRGDNGIFKAHLDGTNIRKIVTLPVLASGLAIDNKRERIYSAQWNIKRKYHEIVAADFSGKNKTILFSNRALLRSVSGMFYDKVHDKLYISDLTKQQIVSLDLKTKELKKLVSANRPEGLTVDYKNNRVIWADNALYSVNIDGSDKKILIPSEGEKRIAATVTIDTTNNHLLFGYLLLISDANNNQNNENIIEVSNLDGTQRKKIKSRFIRSPFFFNNNFIVSKKAESNQQKVIVSQDKLMITSKLKQCFACHGKDWSKSALGKSLIVKNMSEKNIAKALKGYKNGSYGGPMKGIMKGQVARYTDKELDAIAQAIRTQ
ncbi:hypothetical protein [Sulfurimonas sp.]